MFISRQCSFRDNGIHLDLDEKLGPNETRHLHASGCGIDAFEGFPVCASELLETGNIGHERTGPNDIAQVRTQLLKSCLNPLDTSLSLAIAISLADDVAVFVHRDGTGNDDGVPHPLGAALRGFGFPGPPGIDTFYHRSSFAPAGGHVAGTLASAGAI
jgi:hypothetical protein